MEFNERLQKFRKDAGLTQESLSELLHISRTAVSKWESGRGYPNLEALKNLSKVFGVSIDELLSGQELLGLAEIDGAERVGKARCVYFGALDLLNAALAFMPLFGLKDGDAVRHVDLWAYAPSSGMWRPFLAAFGLLSAVGLAEIILLFVSAPKARSLTQAASLCLHCLAVLLFALAREPYATSFVFLLLLAKAAAALKSAPRPR